MSIDEHPAGLGWRIGARVVDSVVFTWVCIFVLVELDQRLFGGDPLGQRQASLVFDSARSVIILLILVLAYEVMPTVLYGATPGKAILGLRVRLTAASVPIAAAVLGRAAIVYLPLLFLGPIGIVTSLVLLGSIVLAKNGRGLHDRLLGTLVVSVPREGPADADPRGEHQ